MLRSLRWCQFSKQLPAKFFEYRVDALTPGWICARPSLWARCDYQLLVSAYGIYNLSHCCSHSSRNSMDNRRALALGFVFIFFFKTRKHRHPGWKYVIRSKEMHGSSGQPIDLCKYSGFSSFSHTGLYCCILFLGNRDWIQIKIKIGKGAGCCPLFFQY